MRPITQKEGRRTWKVLPKYSSIAQTTPQGQPLPDRILGRNFFSYDQTYGEDATTPQVYQGIAQNIVASVVEGLNGTVFAYGQTSSGKTYTMQGSGSLGENGLIHLAATDLFDSIAKQKERAFLVRVSFLEIYNEEVRDLLVLEGGDNKTLPIREDAQRGVFVQAHEEVVSDWSGLLEVLRTGEQSRAFAATAMNERSSRSHTLFRICLESRAPDGAVRVSTLNLVDLAGSESARLTGATGERLKEGGMINTR